MIHRIAEKNPNGLFSFSCLRRYIGGYHANSHLACILSSVFVGGSSLMLNRLWQMNVWLGFGIIFALFPAIVKTAPVLHENHPVTASQKVKAHRWGIILFVVESMMSLMLYFVYPYAAYAVVTGIITASFFCILGCFRNFTQSQSVV